MVDSDICPVDDALTFFNRKWIFCILMDMFRGNAHFNEFKESNPKLSSYVLSKTLKYMEENLLIEKKSNNGKTEYGLTERGLKVNKILYELTLFSVNELNTSKLNDKDKNNLLNQYKKALNIR